MAYAPSQRLQAWALLASALVAALLLVYLALNPAAFADVHPLPLVFLLVLTVLVAVWQGWTRLR